MKDAKLEQLKKMFGLYQSMNRKRSLTDQLLAVPKPDKPKGAMPQIRSETRDGIHQADLLFLPYITNRRDYRYLLVVVDAWSKLVDFEPLKTKDSSIVRDAIKKIYKRKFLSKPLQIQVDAGSEFKGDFRRWAIAEGVELRVAVTGRHRAQGLVEAHNARISTALNHYLVNKELITGKKQVKWWLAIDKLRELLNYDAKSKLHKIEEQEKKTIALPKCAGKSCELLEAGTKVRRQLDYPITATNQSEKLHGIFRKGDIRWENVVREIDSFYLRPHQPPLYILKDIDNVAYTRNQLQLVHENEEPVILANEKHEGKFEIEKILKRVKKKNRIYFVVQWKGFTIPTIEPRSTLIKDVPKVVKEFESKSKKN